MGEIYLSDENDNPAAVELFIHWLYKDAIPSVPREGIWRLSWEYMDTNGTLAMLRPYHDLYYIAEKWCAPLLKDEILDKIREFHRRTSTFVHPDLIVKGFINTSESSPLRRYLAQAGAFALKQNEKQTYLSKLCESNQDVALKILQKFVLLRDFGSAQNPDDFTEDDFRELINH